MVVEISMHCQCVLVSLLILTGVTGSRIFYTERNVIPVLNWSGYF